MTGRIDARTLKAWLSDGAEIAFLDVRELGQYGEGHAFFAVSLPYSRFELGLPALVPRPATRLVLCDGADGVANRTARRAEALGYANVSVLEDGVDGWRSAGYTLYAGVNVPSKTFGELVEQVRRTPHVTAETLRDMQAAGEDLAIVDGRTFAEFQKMSIPGGVSCPNGELALRIGGLAPDPRTKIVVNCAGRTRSIIGAQTLIDFGIPNPVYALENGTQGWSLAGLQLAHGAGRRHREPPAPADLGVLRGRARALAAARGVAFVSAREVEGWLADRSRTTYLLDVRTPEEFAASPMAGFVHAPGGQLVQATDQWIGTRGARIVLVDDEEVRAPMTAQWLRQLGHEACVLEGGTAAAATLAGLRHAVSPVIPEAEPQSRLSGTPAVEPADPGSQRWPRTSSGAPARRQRPPYRPACEHELPQGAHRRRRLVDPAPDRRRGRRSRGAAGAHCRRGGRGGARRARPGGSRRAARSACWPAGKRPHAPPACRWSRRRTRPPTRSASISCSSPTAATRATPTPRAAISPGRSASSVSSTPQERAAFRL